MRVLRRTATVLLALYLSGCTPAPTCTPEAPPPVTPDVNIKLLDSTFSSSFYQVRIESEKVTCWVAVGAGKGISCLSDHQRGKGGLL